MKCTDPKRAGGLAMWHGDLIAQMSALVDTANRTGRELSGVELLAHDRLAAQAAKVLADLKAIDPLAARAAGSAGAVARPAPFVAPSSGVLAGKASFPTLTPRFSPSGMKVMMGRIQGSASGYLRSKSVVCGYAVPFGAVSRPGSEIDGRRMVVLPNAFKLTGSDIRLCRDHRADKSFASTREGSLKVWQDDRGLAISARVGDDELLRAIASGVRGLSVMMSAGWKSDVVVIAGEEIDAVYETAIDEISILKRPAFSGASCWLEVA